MATDRVCTIFSSSLLLLLLIIELINCKVYERCELARELKFLHQIPIEQIPTWVCIVKHESSFNTSATNDGSGDHGLFQISDLYWCSPPGRGYACNAPCSAFEDDDISDDIVCIKRIFKEHQYLSGDGFNAWVVYPRYCKGDVTHYIQGCFDDQIDNVIEHGIANQTGLNASQEGEEDGDGYEFPALPSPPALKIDPTTRKPPVYTTTTTKRPVYTTTATKRPVYATTTTKRPVYTTTTTKRPVYTTKQPTKYFKKFTTLKPYFSTAKASPFKHLITATTTTTPKPLTTKRLTTLKPFSALLEQKSHNEYKRENTIRLDADYTFVRTLTGAPILLSFPHLLYADDKYETSIEGLHPNESLHDTFATLEPISGAPLKMAKRVQFNMFIRAVPEIAILENVTNSLMPILWVEESMTLSDDMVAMIKKMLLNNLKILEIVKWGLIIVGAITVLVAIILIISQL